MTVTDYPKHTQSKEYRSGVSIETNFHVDDTTRMSVDAHGAAHIMSLLTDLYSDPEGSVIREYISNAYDSHAVAGQTRPIEVTLPSPLEPKFVVQDFGTGMSAEDIRKIYSSYGASTKRDDFTQIGAFGLGCKSALTMTQQFTLRSVKNGQKTVAVVTRGEDGVGEIKITSVKDTDEPNGVSVLIPIRDVNKFNKKAQEFFFTLPKDSLIVDGVLHTSNIFSDDYVKMEGLETYISRKPIESGSYYDKPGGFFIILGGVSYEVDYSEIYPLVNRMPVNKALHDNFSGRRNFKVYTTVPIGSIDLVPSREAIRYSDRSAKFLSEMFSKVSEKFIDVISNDISEAPTRGEAFARLATYEQYVGGRHLINVTWQGEPFVRVVDVLTANIVFSGESTSRVVNDQFNLMRSSVLTGYNRTVGTHYFMVIDAKDTEEFCEQVDKIRTNFKGFVRRDEENGIYDPIQSLYVFYKKAPETKWFTELDNFTEISEDTVADGARQWRRWRRKSSAANRNNSGASDPITYPVVSANAEGTLVFESLSASDIDDDALVMEQGVRGVFDQAMSGYPNARASLGRGLVAQGLVSRQIVYVVSSRKVGALEKRTKASHTPYLEHIAPLLKKATDGMSPLALSLVGFVSSYYRGDIDNLVELAKRHSEVGDDDLEKFHKAYAEMEKFKPLVESLSDMYIRVHADRTEAANLYGMLDERYPLLRLTDYGAYGNIDHAIIYMKAINSLRKDA